MALAVVLVPIGLLLVMFNKHIATFESGPPQIGLQRFLTPEARVPLNRGIWVFVGVAAIAVGVAAAT